MSAINGKKLKAATLHFPIHTADSGQIGPKLTNTSDQMHKAVDMTIDEPWVIVKATVPNSKRVVTIPVPITSFSHTQLADET